jgi:hypothetical protein
MIAGSRKMVRIRNVSRISPMIAGSAGDAMALLDRLVNA